MPDLPSPVVEDNYLKNSINAIFKKTNLFSHTIYLTILGLLILAMLGMGIFNIPVFIQSRGIIRPSAEVSQILSPVQGIIRSICTEENQFVYKGDQIICLESDKETVQMNLIISELNYIDICLKDLYILTGANKEAPKIESSKYRFEYQLYSENIKDLDLRINLIKNDFKRFEQLYNQNYLSKKEYEESELKYKLLIAEKNKLVLDKHKQWANEQNEFILRKNVLTKSLRDIEYYIQKSVVTAPFSGIVQGIRNRYEGEYCTAGIAICKLIPDTNLVAEVYIPPKDIGFISAGQIIRLLIDSYDFKYWGTLEARCISISNDIEVLENQALYRIICSIPPDAYLEYRNKRVFPGKGMTLTAQFLVAEKSVWQLLRDNTYNAISEVPN